MGIMIWIELSIMVKPFRRPSQVWKRRAVIKKTDTVGKRGEICWQGMEQKGGWNWLNLFISSPAVTLSLL